PALAAGGQGDGTRPASADQASPSDLPSVTAQAAIPDIGGPASGLDAPDGTDPSAGFAPADGGQNADTSPQAPRGAAPSSATAEAAPSLSTRSADAPTVAAGPGGFASPLPSEEAAAPSAPADMPAPAAISGQGSPAVSEPDVGSAGAVPKVATAPAAPLEPVQQPAEPRLAALPQIGMDRPSTASPRNHTIGSRLPGRKQAETPPEPEIEQAPSEPPIVANAEPFENPDDKPLMSIILIDEPGSIGAEALADFPYPLTFALDPTAPGAVEKMKAHRAVGFEVVAMVDFPPTAQPSDAEVSMSVWLDTINQAVAVLEGPNSGFQGNRPVADQVTEIVAQEGYGLITLDNGLNTVQKLAARRGVPSTVVFRDFDGAGQTPTVMRRFLDQAAFRAGQRGAVVMLGRVRPDTVSALLLWGLQDRANRVALAPISAILTAGTR
ncbi:MAG: divergent polysaccharide deacetylase family protein, partial [Marinibacterium sp.]